VPPIDYLKGLLRLGKQHGTVVIFDEVMTGFRLALGGAQERFGISAPVTCLGKIVGGGLPIGAFGGKREIMDLIAPQGTVYQAGTLSGNPVAVSAGLKTLEILERDRPYDELERRTAKLCRGLDEAARNSGHEVTIHQCGSMFTLFFAPGPIDNFAAVKGSDTDGFARFFTGMLEAGVYLAPSQFEACFVSIAHDESIIDETVEKAGKVLKTIPH